MELRITEYNEDITRLFELLMTLEMQLIEQLEVRRAAGREWACQARLKEPGDVAQKHAGVGASLLSSA